MTTKKHYKGFTLIELIVVVAILGILAAILIPQFTGFQERARAAQLILDAKQVATAIDTLKTESETGAYPTDPTEVLKLAGLADDTGAAIERNGAAIVLALDAEADGGFTLTESVDPNKPDTNKMTYGRDDGNSPVVKK